MQVSKTYPEAFGATFFSMLRKRCCAELCNGILTCIALCNEDVHRADVIHRAEVLEPEGRLYLQDYRRKSLLWVSKLPLAPSLSLGSVDIPIFPPH